MAYIIKVEEWSGKAPEEQRKAIAMILTHMARTKSRGSYHAHLPLDYTLKSNQGFVGQCLFTIMERCHKERIPYLNYLVGRADKSVFPQAYEGGVGKLYEGKFKTLAGFDVYCTLQADLAEKMLQCGAIVIETSAKKKFIPVKLVCSLNMNHTEDLEREEGDGKLDGLACPHCGGAMFERDTE